MSGHVIPMRSTFAASDVPRSRPAAMRALPEDVEVSAMALAKVNGEHWPNLTPTLKDRYRQTAVLAALLIDPMDRRLVAYMIEGQRQEEFVMWPRDLRRDETRWLAVALGEAAQIAYGLQPLTLAARQALMTTDEATSKKEGRLW